MLNRYRTAAGPFRVRLTNARTLAPDLVRAWSRLEARALEPNAYLSPHFVLPALQHLDPSARVFALVIEHRAGAGAGATQLAGVGIFQWVKGTRALPLPHLVAYRSRHSFLSGILLERECAAQALDALLRFMRGQTLRFHGLEFEGTWGDGPTYDLFEAASQRRVINQQEWNVKKRAVLLPMAARAEIESCLTSQDRDLRRRMRRLEEQGKVSWALHRGGSVGPAMVETFLDLEHRGWKGETKTSLRSHVADEQFFRAAVARFAAEGRAIFTELSAGGKVVSATSNFVSGRWSFAFKVGWLPELAKVSPGVLNEREMLLKMYSEPSLADIEFWDSGAAEGSFIDKLWPGRRALVSLAIATSGVGRRVMTLVRTARMIRREYRARQQRPPTTPAPAPAPDAAGVT